MLKLGRTKKGNGGKTILIVDDDPAIREALEHRLAGCPWHVLTAADGQEALEIAARRKPDLVLLDISMPRVNGHAVLERLREDTQMAGVDVIMVTASQEVADVTKAASYNVRDYVIKPFYPGDVVSRIEHVLGTSTH